jgi:hypothetical protein
MSEDKKAAFAADKASKQRSRELDASAAMAEYKASKVADQTKTARLRALRLAKEADVSGSAEKLKADTKPTKPQRATKRR